MQLMPITMNDGNQMLDTTSITPNTTPLLKQTQGFKKEKVNFKPTKQAKNSSIITQVLSIVNMVVATLEKTTII